MSNHRGFEKKNLPSSASSSKLPWRLWLNLHEGWWISDNSMTSIAFFLSRSFMEPVLMWPPGTGGGGGVVPPIPPPGTGGSGLSGPWKKAENLLINVIKTGTIWLQGLPQDLIKNNLSPLSILYIDICPAHFGNFIFGFSSLGLHDFLC